MKCHEINYILDTREPGEFHAGQKEAVDQHFTTCRACREAWAAYREVSALQIPQTPKSLYSRIAAALVSTEAQSMRGYLIVGGVLAFGAAVAAAVALRVTDGMSESAQRLQQPAPAAPTGSPARQERAPGLANRTGVAVSENPNEASDSTSSRTEHALDPNTIVVLPVPHPELDPGRAALFGQFHEGILRRLQQVPGLNVFVVEPRVKAALVQAQASDPSEIVREAAQRALLTDEEVDQRALQKLLDETLPAQERLIATSIHEGRNVREVPLTREAARAVFDIGVKATDPGIRGWAWSRLGRSDVDDPSFTSVLLDDLATHPNDEVRAVAANALAQYIGDPTVRAALEQAESEASFAVRYAVRRALGKVPD